MSIPVLGIPYINRPDLLKRCIASIDTDIERLVIIDNSFDGSAPEIPGALITRAYFNLGVAAAWNFIIKANPKSPWWAISNSDIIFAPGDLERLANSMQRSHVSTLLSFSMFGVDQEAIREVGFFDENFVPAYYEDNDFRYRCKLAGVDIAILEYASAHTGSATIESNPHYRAENTRTFDQNKEYFKGKWGGDKYQERFRSPWNFGGEPSDWVLDMERLRNLSWTPG